MTKISVITPSYNRASFIPAAIESVLAQNYADFEHIIIDGGSTDETLPLLKTYPHLRVVSESDHGVYDALNKGIALARGGIIAQLNSDDRFEPEIFPIVAELFEKNPAMAAVSAGARVFETTSFGERTLALYPGVGQGDLPFRATLGAPIFNAWFFRRDVFSKIGCYSLEYQLAADRDFLMRFFLGGLSYLTVDETFYHYCQHPLSLTINQMHDRQDYVHKEAVKIAEQYIYGAGNRLLAKFCSRWRDRAFIELFASALLRRDLRAMTHIAFDASRKNPLWPFKLLLSAPLGLTGYLRKRYAR
jgi:glycosyltransferase involved in cell wall biosynthesis